jgi:broad specificity phosphatase PhoE
MLFENLFDTKSINMILVRHGQAGRRDPDSGYIGRSLTKTGIQQAKSLGVHLSDLAIDCFYSSDMARSFQTAKELHIHHPHSPFFINTSLREITGLSRPEAPLELSDSDKRVQRNELSRGRRFARDLRMNHHSGDVVAVVAHAGINNLILANLCHLRYRKTVRYLWSHTSVSVLNVTSSSIVFRTVGYTNHLTSGLITYENDPD